MSIFKAFFGLGKPPKVIKYFEFRSFDEVNKMGGYLHALKNEARITGRKFSPAQEKYIEDQFRQVKLVFEQIEKHGKQEKAIKKATSAKVFDLKGKQLDPDMPIMGGTQKKELSEAAIKTKLEASNKKSADRIRIDKIKKEISDLETQINEAEEARSFWSVDEYKKNEEKLSDLITKRNDKEIELELYEDFTGPEDFAGGGIAGMLGEPTYEEDNHRVPLKWGKRPITAGIQVLDPDFDDEDFDMEELIKALIQSTQERWRGKYQTGGRVPFAMGRRAFLKLLGGVGAGIGAAKAGLGSLFKAGKPTIVKDLTQVPIKNADGMPSWFKPLVNRVIQEGDDITKLPPIKGGAMNEREIVHSAKLGEGQGVRVYQNLDDQTIRVEYQSADNMGGVGEGWASGYDDGIVRLEYKAPEDIFDTGPAHVFSKEYQAKKKVAGGTQYQGKSKPEFSASEDYPLQDPKDYKYITWEDSNITTNVDDLFSDTSALKQFATGKPLSKKELEIAKQKRKRVKKINEDPGGEELAPLYDPPKPDYASGGRVPFSGGKKVLQGLAKLMDEFFPGTTKIGKRSKPYPEKVQEKMDLRKAIADFQEREKAAKAISEGPLPGERAFIDVPHMPAGFKLSREKLEQNFPELSLDQIDEIMNLDKEMQGRVITMLKNRRLDPDLYDELLLKHGDTLKFQGEFDKAIRRRKNASGGRVSLSSGGVAGMLGE